MLIPTRHSSQADTFIESTVELFLEIQHIRKLLLYFCRKTMMIRILPLEATPMAKLIREQDWESLNIVLSNATGSVDSWGIRTCNYSQLETEKKIPLLEILRRTLEVTNAHGTYPHSDALVTVVEQLNRLYQETSLELFNCSITTLVLHIFNELPLLQGGCETEISHLEQLNITAGIDVKCDGVAIE